MSDEAQAAESSADRDSVREHSERREQRYRRKAVRLSVRISSIDPEIDPQTGESFFRSCEDVCANLSRGGAFVATSEPPRPGQRVLVELELPGGRPVQTIARVAWSRVRLSDGEDETGEGCGVEFLGGAPMDLQAIERFVGDPSPARPRRSAPEPARPAPNAGTAGA